MWLLLLVSRAIDAVTTAMGRLVSWAVVAAAVVSAGNAIVRKVFDTSSNAWLEAQWWLFGLVFLLAAPWTLKCGEHIRIDILYNRFSQSFKNWINVVGHGLFLLPVAAVIIYTAWPFAISSFLDNEQSANAGGLPQWPAKMLIPIAFTVLFIQGVSEFIKALARMRGDLAPEEEASGLGAISLLEGQKKNESK